MDFSWTEKELSCRELLKSHVDFQTKGTQAPIIIFGPKNTFLDQILDQKVKRFSKKSRNRNTKTENIINKNDLIRFI